MRRRSFLRGLASAIVAPVVLKLAPLAAPAKSKSELGLWLNTDPIPGGLFQQDYPNRWYRAAHDASAHGVAIQVDERTAGFKRGDLAYVPWTGEIMHVHGTLFGRAIAVRRGACGTTSSPIAKGDWLKILAHPKRSPDGQVPS